MSPLSVRSALATLPIVFPLVHALHRTVGDPNDKVIQAIAAECMQSSTSTNTIGFGYNSCSRLVRCVQDALPSDISAGMQAGGTIASLIPTILALIGAPPLELVQLAFASPHRALATCIFGISLPSGLFRQLRARNLQHGDGGTPPDTRRREWRVRVPRKDTRAAAGLAKTLVIDALILAVAGVMVWRNAVICFQTMVTWRCEYSLLLIYWPIACVLWLGLALLLLHALAAKVEITPSSGGQPYSRLDLVLLPYRGPPASSSASSSFSTMTLLDLSKAHPVEMASPLQVKPYVVVAVTMRHDRSWAWFEAATEAFAVGVYLYATFVIASSLYLSGEQAIVYATVMILGMSAIRVLEAL